MSLEIIEENPENDFGTDYQYLKSDVFKENNNTTSEQLGQAEQVGVASQSQSQPGNYHLPHTEYQTQPTVIKVVGVGGGGCNAINRMIESGMRGVDFIAVNTDLQSLAHSRATTRLQIGVNITRGLGAGANPQIGKESAEEQEEQITEALRGANMVFITTGMGGGTGTGAAPVVARIAKKLDALTVGVVTKPFHFEKKRRMEQAEAGIHELQSSLDTIIVIPNENLLHLDQPGLSINDSFLMADSVLMNGVRGIADLVVKSGLINVDFADVKTVMEGQGSAVMCSATFDSRLPTEEIVEEVTNNPLVEGGNIEGAKGVLINLIHGKDTSILDAVKIIDAIADRVDPEATCINGFYCDDKLGRDVKVTLIATGFEAVNQEKDDEKVADQGEERRIEGQKEPSKNTRQSDNSIKGNPENPKTSYQNELDFRPATKSQAGSTILKPGWLTHPISASRGSVASITDKMDDKLSGETEKSILEKSLFDDGDEGDLERNHIGQGEQQEEKIYTFASDPLSSSKVKSLESTGAEFSNQVDCQIDWSNSKDVNIPAFIRMKRAINL